MEKRLKRYIESLIHSKRPVKFIASRLLWHTGLCRLIKIKCRNYFLRFYPTALSASIWIDPDDRHDDEVFLASYLKKGDVVIDIGSNIGNVALASAALTGTSGRIFAFEPNPRIFEFLNFNIRLNGFNNIKTFNLALGNRVDTIMITDFHSDDQNIVQFDGAHRNTHRISMKPLDDVYLEFFNCVNKIALMKIDVEGFELFVLKGARKLISKCDCIYIESYEKHFKRYGYSTNDLLDLLCGYGFNLYRRNGKMLDKIVLPHLSSTCENIIAFRAKQTYQTNKNALLL